MECLVIIIFLMDFKNDLVSGMDQEQKNPESTVKKLLEYCKMF